MGGYAVNEGEGNGEGDARMGGIAAGGDEVHIDRIYLGWGYQHPLKVRVGQPNDGSLSKYCSCAGLSEDCQSPRHLTSQSWPPPAILRNASMPLLLFNRTKNDDERYSSPRIKPMIKPMIKPII